MTLYILVALTATALIIIHFQKLNKIMATQAQHAQELRDVIAQNEKARLEILKKIADLEQAIIDGGGTTPEVDAALAELKASVQTDDDIVPDAPPVEPV